MNKPEPVIPGIEEDKQEWLEALADIYENYGAEGVQQILAGLSHWRSEHQIGGSDVAVNTPYLNTIPLSQQPVYPGDQEIEQRIENILRWNAMAMVLKAQDSGSGVGGHISTYASAATMMEVGFNHFFRKRSEDYGGEHVEMVKAAGFEAAVATDWGVLRGAEKRFEIPRFTPWDRQRWKFNLRLAQNYLRA